MARPTRLITIAPAAPGWWAKFNEDNGPTWCEPIAFWQMVEEYEEDSYGHLVPDANRLRLVQGVSPVGEGWAGESVEDYPSQFKGYFFDPDIKEPFFEVNFGASDQVAK
jgi:hypothetical protein